MFLFVYKVDPSLWDHFSNVLTKSSACIHSLKENSLSGLVLVQSGRKPQMLELQRRNTDQNQAGLGLMASSDLQSMAREEGEGMETTETESLSPALTPLPSLERLLTSPDPKQGMFERRHAHC